MKTKQDKYLKYLEEYSKWRDDLQPYHTGRFDKNYRQYTAYASTEGNEAEISDPVASELTERQINRMFQRDPKFFVLARGKNIPKEITEIISAVPSYYWTCPERVKTSGSMKEKLKELAREFCVTGNTVMETYFNERSETPDARVKPVEDLIFNPSYNLKTSPVDYSEEYVDLDYIRDRVEITEDGQVIKGLFDKKAVKRLEEIFSDSTYQDNPQTNKVTRSGSDEIQTKVGPICLITRVDQEGNTCRFVKGAGDDEVVVLQEFKSILGESAFDKAMDIKITKQPYAFSMLDFLNGLTTLKDLTLNQLSSYYSKLLNPPLFVDPTLTPVNRATLSNAWRLGGIVFAPPQQAEHKMMPPIGNTGFDMLGYIQQRAEAISSNPSALGGTSNPVTDPYNKTARGRELSIEQAGGTVEERRQNIEENIIEPMANKWLKMAGYLMGQDEIKYVLITGQSPKWVKVTKGLLTGKVMLADLLEAELLDEMETQEIMAMMIEQGKDPNKDLVFDVDWVVKVELGSTAEADKQKELDAFDTTIKMGAEMGVPLDTQKIWVERAIRAGLKEPEQYISQQPPMSPETGMQPEPVMIGSTPVEGLMQQNGEIIN